jgi:uncharacterized Zn-finger protein
MARKDKSASEPPRTDPAPRVPEPPEIIVVEGHRVSCDGGGGALGHPKVFYELGEEGFVDCGYCDRRFVRRGSAHGAGTR